MYKGYHWFFFKDTLQSILKLIIQLKRRIFGGNETLYKSKVNQGRSFIKCDVRKYSHKLLLFVGEKKKGRKICHWTKSLQAKQTFQKKKQMNSVVDRL